MALTALSACRNNSGNTTDAPAPQPPIARADNATVAEESQGNRIDVLANDSAADTPIRLDSVEASSENGGSARLDGQRVVYDAPSGAISGVIVDGIEDLVGGVVQDVTTRTENVDGNPDDFDARTFIKAILAVEGYNMGVAGSGYDSKDDRAFFGVIPGTQVDFSIDFYNDVRMPADTSQIFQARIIVVGNGVADLDARNVYIIVPPEGAVVLI